MEKIGTFTIHGNADGFYWIVDHCTFNNWGIQPKNGTFFKTLEEAWDYARRCHDFKEGRRMSV